MSRTLLLATRNRGKIREFTQLFADLAELHVIALDALPPLPEVIEDGHTFAENAAKKAREIARATSLLVLSDDSGLEVDALDGRPGVRSARYAHEHATDTENNERLIAELRDVPPERRSARYRVVLALADPQGPLRQDVHLEDGVCEGSIRLEPRGSNGFGYDPYFEPRGHTLTMAELSPEQKNRISHRAQASDKMRHFLQHYLRPTPR